MTNGGRWPMQGKTISKNVFDSNDLIEENIECAL